MTNDKKIAAVIVAAGFSSRIGAFKPLLPMGSSTIIETAINTFRSIGVGDIVVITGYNAEVLEAHIAHMDAICLRSDYMHNKMFYSAGIGIRRLKNKCDMTFFTPADSPLFTKYSLKAMLSQMRSSDCTVLCPCYNQGKGHPLLIKRDSFDDILAHDGTEGMKGAVGKLKGYETMSLPDPALIMDADTPEAYEVMKRYDQERAVPSDESGLRLHEYFHTPANVIKHCEMVAHLADAITKSLIKKGCFLDLKKIRAAALLHDILRAEKNHAARGAALLEDLGHTGISSIVGAHMELDEYDATHITEKTVVYLADKRVCKDSITTLKERFDEKMSRHQNDEKAYSEVQRKYKQALQVEEMISRFLNHRDGRSVLQIP